MERQEQRGVTHVPEGEGKKVWSVGTDLITFKATGEDTGGAFALFDMLVLPGGGPPPHIHTRESESFYVLEGEFEFLAGDEWIKASPGSFVHVPKGALHTLKNAGSEVGRLLTLVAPACPQGPLSTPRNRSLASYAVRPRREPTPGAFPFT